MRAIQLTCSRCNATMFLEKERGYSKLSCPYCGSSMQILMESDKVKIAEIRANTDIVGMDYSYRKHRDHLIMEWAMQNSKAILIGFAVLITLILMAVFSIRNKDRIRIPFSSNDLNNKAYQDVQTMFIDAGFSDISILTRDDLWDGFLHDDKGKIEKVAQVTINGDERFRENESFSKDSKIRIWYHIYP